MEQRDTDPADRRDPRSDEQAVRALHAAWIAAVNAGDVACLLSLMTGDAVFLSPGREPVGREAFAAGFTAAHEQSQLRCASQLQDIVVAGDVAYTVCRDALGVRPHAGGAAVELAGHRMSIYRRQPDGRWLLARDAHTLTPAAPMEGRDMPLTSEQRQALRKRCTLIVPGFDVPDAAGEFRQLADWCAEHGLDHDVYGKGELVEGFERKVADLLGKPAAVFMPSGVMAQLVAVRLWTEAARLPRFGMHPTSHLAHHEEQAFAALMHLHGVPVGDRLRPMTAADLEAIAQPLACAIVELPIREAGGQLRRRGRARGPEGRGPRARRRAAHGRREAVGERGVLREELRRDRRGLRLGLRLSTRASARSRARCWPATSPSSRRRGHGAAAWAARCTT